MDTEAPGADVVPAGNGVADIIVVPIMDPGVIGVRAVIGGRVAIGDAPPGRELIRQPHSGDRLLKAAYILAAGAALVAVNAHAEAQKPVAKWSC